jgi:hypothetical protein
MWKKALRCEGLWREEVGPRVLCSDGEHGEQRPDAAQAFGVRCGGGGGVARVWLPHRRRRRHEAQVQVTRACATNCGSCASSPRLALTSTQMSGTGVGLCLLGGWEAASP